MKKILIVDDDSAIRRVLAQILEANGYFVATAASRQDARALLEQDKDFALFILDFWIGSDTGLDVMNDLQRLRPLTPVLFLSGGSEDVALETSTALGEMRGACAFLYKPVPSAILLDAVKRHI